MSLVTLDQTWPDPCGPGRVVAERRLCLPKGRYVFETRASDHADVTVDGTAVIAPRIELARTIGGEPVELSRPLDIDGCASVRVEMPNLGCFPQSRLQVTHREAARVEPCDEGSYPKDGWNACIFAGRRREELRQKEVWRDFVSPWKAGGGPHGWEDNFSVEARTTACFDGGAYVFHARVPREQARLFLDDKLLLQPAPTPPRDVVDTEPMTLRGCHRIRAVYAALDRNTSFEMRWAKVGSAVQRRWAEEALACVPACDRGARCVPARPYGTTEKNARICLPAGRPGKMGEACSAAQPCSGGEVTCCRPGEGCDRNVTGVCTYHDR